MGKHDSGANRESLIEEHMRIVEKHKRLEAQNNEVIAIFQKLDELYQSSKGTFTTGRYGQLKDMIKNAASDANLEKIRQTVQENDPSNANRGGITSLLNRAQEFQVGATSPAETDDGKKSGKKSGFASSFMKKLKNATGFSDEPVKDEDVMSDADLQRDNGRKQRAIQRYLTNLSKALTKLEKLKLDYETSKKHAPPKRYQELKDMIKVAVADRPS